MSDTQEIVQRLEREMADRAAAVEKVDVFKAQFNQAIKAFMAADEAVRSLNDHDSIVDTQIANAKAENMADKETYDEALANDDGVRFPMDNVIHMAMKAD